MAMKWCINCDALFVPNPKESDAQWARRRFCSRRCASRWNALRKPGPTRGRCANCDRPVLGLIRGLCKQCWEKRRYRNQRERLLELNRAWREANPDYWRQPHIQARVRRWQREHPEQARRHVLAAKRRRRARKLGASVSDIAATEEYIAILRLDVCAYCGAAVESIDHIDALAAGGDHVWDNLTPACRSCNSRKHGASLLRFLLRIYPPQTGHGEEPCCA